MPTLKPNKNYGDQGAIDSLVRQASGMKQAASDTVPTARNPVGRPQGSGSPTVVQSSMAAPQGGGALDPTIPADATALMERAARMTALAQMTAGYADDPLYGTWMNEYAKRMRSDAEQALRDVKDNTPDFNVG